MDVKTALLTSVSFAQPATGMQVVLENPRLGRAVALSDLLRQAFILTRDHIPNDIWSREISMVHVSKLMESHLLLGNFATNGDTNNNNKANAVNPSAFLPHRNLSSIESEHQKDQNSRNKTGMDVIYSQKTKTSIAII
jgi:hypothetical protein